MKFKIAVLPGDGVGPDVVTEAQRVLDAVARRSALRLPSPLIKPDVRVARIRLSD